MNKALQYAEDTLGVHKAYEEATAARVELDQILGDLDKAHDSKRRLSASIDNRSFELLIIERGRHADKSATALDQHMKIVKFEDKELRKLRHDLDSVLSTIQGLEYDAEIQRYRIKIETARLEELSGYLHYLAAIKEGETLAKGKL